MVLTHSSAKAESIAISENNRNYSSDIIKPLVATQYLGEMFYKPKKEIVPKLEENLEQQMNRIDTLEGKLERQTND